MVRVSLGVLTSGKMASPQKKRTSMPGRVRIGVGVELGLGLGLGLGLEAQEHG